MQLVGGEDKRQSQYTQDQCQAFYPKAVFGFAGFVSFDFQGGFSMNEAVRTIGQYADTELKIMITLLGIDSS